jgi:hypothetical protein
VGRAHQLARCGFIVLTAGGGILENPAASNTGSMSRTRWPDVVTTSNTLRTSRRAALTLMLGAQAANGALPAVSLLVFWDAPLSGPAGTGTDVSGKHL